MLAYRHAFHAGNHADVLKHLVLVQVLQHMAAKDKPFRLIDTHAGGGGYVLHSSQAQKRAEYQQGIARIWGAGDAPPAVADYLRLVRRFNPDGQLNLYPGSPALSQMLLRHGDQLRLFELHPNEFKILSDSVQPGRQVQLAQVDGFAALRGQVPPSMRRGVVLMDPSYELVSDYAKVIESLRDALLRFAEGVYVIWYPQVSRVESIQMARRLQATAPKGWLNVRLNVQQPDAQGFGLTGSGVFVINPPYTLHAQLVECMPWLTRKLGQFEGANHVLEHHAV